MTSAARSAFCDDARAVPLERVLALVGAQLKGNRVTQAGPCPVCGGRDRFSVNLRKNIWYCRQAGFGGDALDLAHYWLMGRANPTGDEFMAACAFVLGRPLPDGEHSYDGAQRKARDANVERRQREAKRRARLEEEHRHKQIARAQRIWDGAVPFAGTLVEDYLAARSIGSVPPNARLRFHPAVAYWHGAQGESKPRLLGTYPAMVGKITGSHGHLMGVHVTYLADDGLSKRAIVDPLSGERCVAKKMFGLAAGGRIYLGGVGQKPTLAIIAEGIETALSFWHGLSCLDLPERWCVLAALSLTNLGGPAMGRLPHPGQSTVGRAVLVPNGEPDLSRPALDLPNCISEAWILGDGDSDAFITDLALRRAARRFASHGIKTKIIRAPAGMDFNDVLRSPMENADGLLRIDPTSAECCDAQSERNPAWQNSHGRLVALGAAPC